MVYPAVILFTSPKWQIIFQWDSQWLDPLQCLPLTKDPPNCRWSPTPDRSPFSGPSPGGLW